MCGVVFEFLKSIFSMADSNLHLKNQQQLAFQDSHNNSYLPSQGAIRPFGIWGYARIESTGPLKKPLKLELKNS